MCRRGWQSGWDSWGLWTAFHVWVGLLPAASSCFRLLWALASPGKVALTVGSLGVCLREKGGGGSGTAAPCLPGAHALCMLCDPERLTSSLCALFARLSLPVMSVPARWMAILTESGASQHWPWPLGAVWLG